MQKNNRQNEQDFNRLKWACRRGMLELDVILNAFLEKTYPTLQTAAKNQFTELLTFSDPVLYAWLLGFEPVTVCAMQNIVQIIRDQNRAPAEC